MSLRQASNSSLSLGNCEPEITSRKIIFYDETTTKKYSRENVNLFGGGELTLDFFIIKMLPCTFFDFYLMFPNSQSTLCPTPDIQLIFWNNNIAFSQKNLKPPKFYVIVLKLHIISISIFILESG